MTRYRLIKPTCWAVLAAALAAGCTDSPTGVQPPPPSLNTTLFGLVIWPDVAELAPGDQQQFQAYACPLDVQGNPIFGEDGVPGTEDDGCVSVTGTWSVEGDIGTIGATTGNTTTLTADLPEGSGLETGIVRVTVGDASAEADVTVVGGEEIGDNPVVYRPCVRFKQGTRNKGEPVCQRNLRRDGTGTAKIGFTEDEKFKVEIGANEFTAPDGYAFLLLKYERGAVVSGSWLGAGKPAVPLAGVNRSNNAEMTFPKGSGGEITSVTLGSEPKDVPAADDGKTINRAELYFEQETPGK